MKNVKFGLLGRNISYSFSKKYFTQKFKELNLPNYSYEIFDIDNINEIKRIIKDGDLLGLNVTIPYKEQVLPFLDIVSAEAKSIGAVNTILIKNGQLKGFNTDVYGFEQTLFLHKKSYQKTAIVLGDGGAAKAVKFIFDKNKIPYTTISRKSEVNFENIDNQLVESSGIIVQCTPVGTFPNIEDSLVFPFESLSERHLVIDLIYNPEQTRFMKNAQKQGAKCVNGYFMLEQQAEKSWEIWNYS